MESPYLLSNEEIIKKLNERELIIANIEQLNREQLLNIYCKFALPLNQRVVPGAKKEISTPVQNGMKFLSISPPGEPNSKRMRITKTEQSDWNSKKRSHEEVKDRESPTKRTKITWP